MKIFFQIEATNMFRKILHWIRVDDSGLGRPKLPGNKPVETLAVPLSVLNLVHEIESLEPEGLNLKEVRGWAIEKIKLHVQRNGSRILENVTPTGMEIPGCEGRKLVPGRQHKTTKRVYEFYPYFLC